MKVGIFDLEGTARVLETSPRESEEGVYEFSIIKEGAKRWERRFLYLQPSQRKVECDPEGVALDNVSQVVINEKEGWIRFEENDGSYLKISKGGEIAYLRMARVVKK